MYPSYLKYPVYIVIACFFLFTSIILLRFEFILEYVKYVMRELTGFPPQRETSPIVPVNKVIDVKSQSEAIDWRSSPFVGSKFWTDDEIEYKQDGTPYLVIIGHVFDITKGYGSYLPGTSYHGFVGRDGSRAYVTGDFTETGLTSDITGLESSDVEGLANWINFYFKTYTFMGYHYGRYFDTNGQATKYFKDFLEQDKLAKIKKNKQEVVNEQYPPCNMEWSEAKGTNVWCTTKSGGIERHWAGYPVRFKESPQHSARCACVKESQFNEPRIAHYKGCVKKRRCNNPDSED